MTASDERGGLVDLSRYALLSLVAGVVVMALKIGAWWVTGSVGLLSDGLESLVNIAAAGVALWSLRMASRPPDARHQFGHGKAEYFSAAVEGGMIVLAATLIVISALPRLLDPQPLEEVGVGLAIAVLASLVNAAVAVVLFRVGRRHRSAALVADAHHLVTDLWTTAGVLVGVLIVTVTGWARLDPLIALAVAGNIVIVGARLLRTSLSSLLDEALPEEDVDQVRAVLQRFRGDDVVVHGLQTRQSGRHRFVTMHVLVPGDWSVSRGHDMCDDIEQAVQAALPNCECVTHLEPLEDPRAWNDVHAGQHPVD